MRWMSNSPMLKPYLPTLIRYAGLEVSLRQMFGREPDEPVPDMTIFPAELFEFTSPPGTYFDAFPVHLLSTASLEAISLLQPGSQFDRRRFRPNFLIETEKEITGFAEAEWCERTLLIGEVKLRCHIQTVRCGMTIQAQEGLDKDPVVLRTIVREAGQNLGIYASVIKGGRVLAGDLVELV